MIEFVETIAIVGVFVSWLWFWEPFEKEMRKSKGWNRLLVLVLYLSFIVVTYLIGYGITLIV